MKITYFCIIVTLLFAFAVQPANGQNNQWGNNNPSNNSYAPANGQQPAQNYGAQQGTTAAPQQNAYGQGSTQQKGATYGQNGQQAQQYGQGQGYGQENTQQQNTYGQGQAQYGQSNRNQQQSQPSYSSNQANQSKQQDYKQGGNAQQKHQSQRYNSAQNRQGEGYGQGKQQNTQQNRYGNQRSGQSQQAAKPNQNRSYGQRQGSTNRSATNQRTAKPTKKKSGKNIEITLNPPPKIEIENMIEFMSQGRNAGLKVAIPEGNPKQLTKSWKKYLKNFNGKTKTVDGNELYTKGLVMPSLSSSPLALFARFDQYPGGVMLKAFFDIGGTFVAKADAAKYEIAEGIISDFAVVEATKSVETQLAGEELKMMTMHSERLELQADEEELLYEIEQYKAALELAREAIKQNRMTQDKLNVDAQQQVRILEQLRLNLQSVSGTK